MKLLISVIILALIGIHLSAAEQVDQTAQHQQQSAVAASNSLERQGRSSGALSTTNNNNRNSNVIEHGSHKERLELDKRQVNEFLTAKSILKTIVNLIFGSQDQISATSRHVIGIIGKVLELLKNTFGQKSRSGTARTLRDSVDGAAQAGISVLQGYVKSMLTDDQKCAQQYLCQASREATASGGRDIGYLIASVGGYTSSYMLNNPKFADFESLYEASKEGKGMKDCAKIYQCKETNGN